MNFPKPKTPSKPWKKVCDDGREILNLDTVRGRREYKARHQKSWEEKHGIFRGICHTYASPWNYSVPDHIIPKGMGGATHDDRTSNLQPKPCNLCNSAKAIEEKYEHGTNTRRPINPLVILQQASEKGAHLST